MEEPRKWDKETKEIVVWLAYGITGFALSLLLHLLKFWFARSLSHLVVFWAIYVPYYISESRKNRSIRLRTWLLVMAATSVLLITLDAIWAWWPAK